MSHHSIEKQTGLDVLVFEYEVASQKGAVPFFEETVFCALADYFEKIRQLGKAHSILSDGLTQHPHSSELYLRRAELLLQNGELEEGRHWLERAANILPDQFRATLARAEAFCHHRNADAALLCLREIRQKPAPKPRASEEILSHLKEISQKFRRLRDILLHEPGNEGALAELWLCVELSGQFAQSAALHARLIDIYPYNSRAWFNLGSAWENLKKTDDALEAYEYSYLIDPDFRDGYEAFGKLASESGHHKQAIRAYKEMMQRLGEDGETLVLLGKCHDLLGNSTRARQLFRRATILDDTCSEAFYRLGEFAAREGQLATAISHFSQALYWDNENEDYHLAIAEAYAATGVPKKAVSHFKKSLMLCCGVPKFWLSFANFYAQSGNWKKALSVLEDGLLNSYGAEMAFFHAAMLFQLGRRAEGFEQLEAAMGSDAEKHESFFRYSPDLKSDADILACIARCQNTKN